MLEIRSVLDSRYEIIENIGNGGMGEVYKALDKHLGLPVAIKLFVANKTDEISRAFHREAQLLSNLKHPALPRVTDYSQNNDIQYLVMEFIEGSDLKTQAADREKKLGTGEAAVFSVDEVLAWSKQLLDVVGYLHRNGIQHRDIKPANIKIRNGQLFLLDFGIAFGQIGDMTTFSLESFFWRSGTEEFSPPEQLNAQKTTPASDLYSVAATLYLLLTGEKAETARNRLLNKAKDKPDPIKPIPASLAGGHVSSALMAALELDMNRRPQSAGELYWRMFPPVAEKPEPKAARKMRKLMIAAMLLIASISGGVIFSMAQEQYCRYNPCGTPLPEPIKPVADPRRESVDLTTEALSLLQAAKYQDSLKKSERAIAKDPGNPFARFVYGDAIWDTEYEEALSYSEMTKVQEQADKILELVAAPETAEEYTARGWANLVKERYDIAISDTNRALELKPDSVAALMIRGSARSFIPDEGNKSLLKAFDDYEKVINLMPNYAQAWANRAAAFIKLKKYEWAISDLTEAVRLIPAARYYNDRGNAYLEQGKYEEARREFQQALGVNKNSLTAHTGLGDICVAQEDWKNAVDHYSKAIAIRPFLTVLRNRGYAYGGLKQFNKSVKDFSDALEMDPTDYLSYKYRGLAYCGLEKWEKALPDLSNAIQHINSGSTDELSTLYSYKAMVHRQLNDEQKARADEKKAATLSNKK